MNGYRTYVFDIDGTIADCTHRLGYIAEKPKRWKHFEETAHLDTPIDETVRIMKVLSQSYYIILCTGRGENMQEKTEQWLIKHQLLSYVDRIYMRKAGDYRPDYVVKGELADEIINDGFNILGVFEDRQGVVDMWRSKGIRCYQVDAGTN